jgi:RimJ/RimL family protein N-acetyltransferase
MSVIRPWRAGDLRSLVANANSRKVWLNLRDVFPHPYREADGRLWLDYAAALDPITDFAVEHEGNAIGGVGVRPGIDVDRASAEIGYWLGEAHWGRGLGTAAVHDITTYVFNAFRDVNRVFALPFARNAGSIRVLEKNRFRREGLLVEAVIKDGRYENQLVYAVTRTEWKSGGA